LMMVVRDNDMPLDDALLYREIDPDTRAALLDYGRGFQGLGRCGTCVGTGARQPTLKMSLFRAVEKNVVR
jgi:hypothetical protein